MRHVHVCQSDDHAKATPTDLASRLSDFSALSMELTNRLTNQVSEYWYMGSMLARSVMEKNRIEEWMAIGL